MKSVLSLLCTLVLLASCAHDSVAERTPAQTAEPLKASSLKPDDITIWSLKALAQSGRLDVLNDLYNNYAMNVSALPSGYAAGTGARVFDLGTPLFGKLIDDLTGANWRGKIFFSSQNPHRTTGLNRIKQTLLLKTTVTPMAKFIADIAEHDSLVPEAKSNVVVLNYAKPVTKNYWQELALTQIEVYDVMVAVPGKYGPVFIGKTWLGKYGKDRNFKANDPARLIAWFFLDFNAESLSVQQSEYWDGANENLLNPLPKSLL